MKPWIIAVLLLAVSGAAAAAPAGGLTFPPGAAAAEQRLSPSLQPSLRAWIASEAGRVSKIGAADLRGRIVARFPQASSPAALAALQFLVLMQSARNAQADINALGQSKDSIGGMSQAQMLALQQAMDRKGQLESMISNVMKSVSDAQSSLVANIKAS